MRPAAFVILLVACAWVLVRPSLFGGERAFDPLVPRGREIERAIEEGRFADALPMAAELQDSHPADPTIAIWIAEVYGGLGRFAEEGHAWSRVLELTREADAACPAMPAAYARAGQAEPALAAYRQCAAAAPDDPERWLDLARAASAAGLDAEAGEALAHARELDPRHPLVAGLSVAEEAP